MSVHIAVSYGEFYDKISILRIKYAKGLDVAPELVFLTSVATEGGNENFLDSDLFDQLQTVNAELWEIEDRIREEDARGEFGETFISLARSVYQTNDRRAEIKRQINHHFGSAFKEVKSYSAITTI